MLDHNFYELLVNSEKICKYFKSWGRKKILKQCSYFLFNNPVAKISIM